MISLTPVITRLQPKPEGFAHLWFRQVAGAAEFAQASAEALPLPAAWIIREADGARSAGERLARVTLSFNVVIAVENARRHKPGETDDILLAYRWAVKDLLLGWERAPGERPLTFEGGRALEVTERDVFWADKYVFDALVDNWLDDPGPFDSLNHVGEKL
ncbi:MAG: hypothetical protein LBF61_00865 [Azoarcus sp.]|jgi:hypothetical protein|nr:hypothetical protein [Azoarcus sp.]